MSELKQKKVGTDPYKGVRDFFPEDMAVEKKIFGIWRNVVEKYGYEEYGASVLEPAELYRNKTSDEIVNEQTYTFRDRGEREVTLRPEMTPTVARMVAARKRELVFPLRWYSIPNLFRYEQPQRGRTREHWQLNVDIFGVTSISAEIEIINIAYDITKSYGLKDTDFEIRLNNRKIMNYMISDVFCLNGDLAKSMSRLIDKKDKLPADTFATNVTEIFEKARNASTDAAKSAQDPKSQTKKFLTLLNSGNLREFMDNMPKNDASKVGFDELTKVIEGLENLGITNARFDQTLMRGFDYYTGIVFEVFDRNPANRRSVFGGGRYDDLLQLFGNDKVTGVGFGAGDLIAKDLMETYSTLPKAQPSCDLMLCIVGEQNAPYALDLAQNLREQGLRVSVDISGKKIGDQISNADKRNVPRIICIGDEEVRKDKFKMKTLSTGEEVVVKESDIVKVVKGRQ